MIDTVVWNVHDLDRHHALMEYLFMEDVSGKTTYNRYHSATKLVGETAVYKQSILKDHNKGFEHVRSHWNKVRVKSSFYDVLCRINFEKDFIEFQISVPKYYYGHNIAQFVPTRHSNGFKYFKEISRGHQKVMLYNRLIKFTKDFFKRTFHNIEVNYACLELKRLDLCYNQFFNTKQEALTYINYQKKLMAKRTGKKSNYGRDNYTSCAFRNSSFYFKIYHKGSEYESKDGDKKKHEKINEHFIKQFKMPDPYGGVSVNKTRLEVEKESLKNAFGRVLHPDEDHKKVVDEEHEFEYDFDPSNRFTDVSQFRKFDVDYLQSIADRCVRYEIEFSKNFFSNYHKRYVFRKSDQSHKWAKEQFAELNRKTKSGQYLDLLEKDELRFFKHYKRWFQRRNKFYMKGSRKLETYESSSQFQKADLSYRMNTKVKSSIFTSSLLRLCVDKFFEQIDEFQVKAGMGMQEKMLKLKEYNAEARRKKAANKKRLESSSIRDPVLPFPVKETKTINQNKMNMLFILMEDLSLDEIKHRKIFPESTFYRYQADLKKLDITRENLEVKEFIKPTTCFSNYYDIQTNKNFFPITSSKRLY